MRPRGWITLSIRLVGLASVLFGVYQVISIIQAAESFKALASLGEFARDTPVGGMFKAEVFARATSARCCGPGSACC